jgi:hypothetical protein
MAMAGYPNQIPGLGGQGSSIDEVIASSDAGKSKCN